MTIEEAIAILSDVGDINRCCSDDAEALDMAIKALEQQPCEDCISRKETIEWLKKVTVTEGISFKTGFEQILYDIEQMPSVTPKTEWIPVSEKKAHFPCLAVDKFGQIFIPQGIVTINNRCYDGAGFDFDVGRFKKGKEVTINGRKAYIEPTEVIAWRPLPTPYKAEGSDSE